MSRVPAHLLMFTELAQAKLLTFVHHDVTSTDGLVGTVVVNHVFNSIVFPPDLDAEGIRAVIASPQHGLVGISIRVESAIDCTAALELGV